MDWRTALRGRSILVVEDEALVALMIEDLIGEAGGAVVGPAQTVAEAIALAGSSTVLDAALLDVNVSGVPVHPVAAVLAARGVPFAFATGYGDGAVGSEFATRPVLSKPFTEDALLRILADLVASAV